MTLLASRCRLLTIPARLQALEARLDARRNCSTGYGCGNTCINVKKECHAEGGRSATGKERMQRLEQLARGEIKSQGIGNLKPDEARARLAQIRQARQQQAQALRSNRQEQAAARAAAAAAKAKEALRDSSFDDDALAKISYIDEEEALQGNRPPPPSAGSASNPRRAFLAAEVELGRGMFGSVRMAQDGLVVKRGVISQGEVRTLRHLEDSGVTPKLHAVATLEGRTAFGTGKNGYLVMDPAKGETLKGWIMGGQRSDSENREVFSAMLRTRKALHTAGVAHNDMHAGNLFWDAGSKTMMAIDFGMSRINPTAALIEGLGTARGLMKFNKVEAPGDYMSRSTIQALNRGHSQRTNPDWQRFQANRRRVEKALKAEGAGELISRSIRSVPKKNLLTNKRAAELVNMLYEGL